ncbi:MAG: HAD family hydrolase [Tissierellia bacterium]|nr:HAD family hydrolase [Tissierellia bacterium]
MKKLWIFDLDGTVLDSLSTIGNHANEVLKEWGYEEIPLPEYRRFVGNGAKNLANLVCQTRGIEEARRSEFHRIYCQRYDEEPVGATIPFPGIPEFLQAVKDRGGVLAILSNKPDKAANLVMEAIYGKGFFDLVLGQRDDYPHKPNPAGLYYLMERFGFTKEETIYFGDMDVDIETGRNAGVDTIAVTWGFRSREELKRWNPKRMVDQVEELYALLDE